MFFNSLSELPHFIQSFSTTIFVLDPKTLIDLKPLIAIEPTTIDSTISVDHVRELIKLTETKQTARLFLLIRHAERLSESASNALLKTIEEPGKQIHIAFLTEHPDLLLPTVRSRAMLFRLRQKNTLIQSPTVPVSILDYAKKLLVADNTTLISLIDEITKKKSKNDQDSDRTIILQIIKTTIEIAYKSYFKTQNPKFLKKIRGLIAAHDAISKNGNKKLQLLANLIS